MSRPVYLADTSVVARLSKAAVQAVVGPLLDAGLVATCPVIEWELGRSARNAGEWLHTERRRRSVYVWVPVPDDAWDRALGAQQMLVASGRHRAIGLADMLIGATAASRGMHVLHYDRDFEFLAEVVDFEQRWVVPAGAVD